MTPCLGFIICWSACQDPGEQFTYYCQFITKDILWYDASPLSHISQGPITKDILKDTNEQPGEEIRG